MPAASTLKAISPLINDFQNHLFTLMSCQTYMTVSSVAHKRKYLAK